MADPDTRRVSDPTKQLVVGQFFDAIIKADKLTVNRQNGRVYSAPSGSGNQSDRGEAIMVGKTPEGVETRHAISIRNGERKPDGTYGNPVVSVTVRHGNTAFMAQYQTIDKDGRAAIDPASVQYYAVDAQNRRSERPLPASEASFVQGHFATVTKALTDNPVLGTNTFREDGTLRVGQQQRRSGPTIGMA